MTGALAPAANATVLPASPFKGLAAFEDSSLDSLLFFGRGPEREVVTANLLGTRLTVLYGASGVGKTSVLRAGVAHELRKLGEESVRAGRSREVAVVVYGTWSGDPLSGLRAAVTADLFADELQPSGASLAEELRAWTDDLELDLYLILDQFEEYAVYHGTGAEGPFGRELAEIVAQPGLRVNTLLSLREDALATVDHFKARLPNLLANRLRLEHLDREAGRSAIVGPVGAYRAIAPPERRMDIEPALAEAVLDQVEAGVVEHPRASRGRGRGATPRGRRIEAPYLQLVMQRVWEAERSKGSPSLTLETLNELGGAQRIVESHLERALATLTPSQLDGAAAIFNHLVTPSGAKVAHGLSDLQAYARVPDGELKQIVRRLSAERILRPAGGAANGEGPRYEIFHDVLADAVSAWRSVHEEHRAIAKARAEADRRRRWAVAIAASSLVALVVMAAITVLAVRERSHARIESRRAHARELAAASLATLETDPERSLRLAVGAASRDSSAAVETALRQALLAWHERLVLRSGGPVTNASFDGAGRRVLTGSRDGTARVYDAASGRLLHVLLAGGPVTTTAFGANGRLVATGTDTGHVRLWSARTGRRLRSWRTGGNVGQVSFGEDSTVLVAAGGDGATRLWRVRSGRTVRIVRQGQPVLRASLSADGRRLVTMTGTDAWLFDASGRLLKRLPAGPRHPLETSASFDPTGRLVVTTSQGRTALLWSARTGALVGKLAGHLGQVTSAAFSPGGKWVATSSTDEAGRVWDAATGVREAVLGGHTNYVYDVGFSPDGLWVATASRDRTARIFDAATGRFVTALIGHTAAVRTAEYAPTGDAVVTASDDGTARVWDPGTEPQLRLLGSHDRGAVLSVSLAHSGRFVVSAGEDATARVWRLRDGRSAGVVRHRRAVTSASFAPDDSTLLTTSLDGTARLSPFSQHGAAGIVLRQGAPVLGGSFDPSGKRVVTAGADGTAWIWRAADGRRLHLLRDRAAVRTASFSPDGSLVLTGSADGSARLWDAARGTLVHELHAHRGGVTAAAFSRDGTTVVTAGADRTAKLWDVRSGRLLHVLEGHRRALTSASFSPGGSLVLTSSRDNDARLWSAASGRTIRVLGGHNAPVSDARFSADGRWIVTAGPKNAALWQTATGRLVTYLRGHRKPLTAATFAPRGGLILTSSADGDVRVYTCEVCAHLDGLVAAADRRLQAISAAH